MNAPVELVEAAQVVDDLLRAYLWRERRLAVLRGLAEGALIFLLGVLALSLIELMWAVPYGARLGLALVLTTAAVGAVAKRSWRALLGNSRRGLAQNIERSIPCGQRLIACVDFVERPSVGVSSWMIARTIAMAANDAAAIDPRVLVDAQPTTRAVRRLTATSILVFVLCFVPGIAALLLRAAAPYAGIGIDRGIRIAVRPGDQIVPHGSPCLITATLSPDPAQADLIVHWADGAREILPMQHGSEAGRYTFEVDAVTQSFRYHVRAEESESATHWIEAAASPLLEEVRVRVAPPDYLGMPAYSVLGGDVEFVAGSELTISTRFAHGRVRSASLILDDGVERALVLDDGGVSGRALLKPTANGSYRLRLVDDAGLATEPSQRWMLRVQRDAAPSLSLQTSWTSSFASPSATVQVVGEAQDDLGLATWSLIAEDEHGLSDTLQLPIMRADGSARRAQAACTVPLSELSLPLGEEIRLHLEATDLGGQVSESEPIALRIASPEAAALCELSDCLKSETLSFDDRCVELQRFARDWSAVMRVYRPDDPDLGRAELAGLENRVADWTRQLATTADHLGAIAGESDHTLTRCVGSFAQSLVDWVKAEDAVFSSASRAASASGQENAALQRGKDLIDAALGDMQLMRQRLVQLSNACTAHRLHAMASIAALRLRRAAAAAEGEQSWQGNGTQLGAWEATYFAGRALEPPALLTRAEMPYFTQQTLLGRAYDWSLRYRGEILIASDGNWDIAITTDDGVRARIDGESIFPPEAWSAHPATESRRRLQLKAGWHRCEVDYFQGDGDNSLQVAIAKADEPLKPVDPSQLRCTTAAARLAAAANPAVRSIARSVDLPKEWRLVAEALAGVIQLGEPIPGMDLPRLNAEVGKVTFEKTDAAATRIALADQVVQAAAAARDALVAKVGVVPADSGPNHALRSIGVRLRDQSRQLAAIEPGWFESERIERLHRSTRLADALIGYARAVCDDERLRALRRARSLSQPLAQRPTILAECLELRRMANALEDLPAVSDQWNERGQAIATIETAASAIVASCDAIDQSERQIAVIDAVQSREEERIAQIVKAAAVDRGDATALFDATNPIPVSQESPAPFDPVLLVQTVKQQIAQSLARFEKRPDPGKLREDLGICSSLLAVAGELSGNKRGSLLTAARELAARLDVAVDGDSIRAFAQNLKIEDGAEADMPELARRLSDLGAAAAEAAREPERAPAFVDYLTTILAERGEASASTPTDTIDDLARRVASLQSDRADMALRFRHALDQAAAQVQASSALATADGASLASATAARLHEQAMAHGDDLAAALGESRKAYDLAMRDFSAPILEALESAKPIDPLRQVGPQWAALLSRWYAANAALDRGLERMDSIRFAAAVAIAERADSAAVSKESLERAKTLQENQRALESGVQAARQASETYWAIRSRMLISGGDSATAVSAAEKALAAWKSVIASQSKLAAAWAELIDQAGASMAMRRFLLANAQTALTNLGGALRDARLMGYADEAFAAGEEAIATVRRAAEGLLPFASLAAELDRVRTLPLHRTASGEIADVDSLATTVLRECLRLVQQGPDRSDLYDEAARRLREAARRIELAESTPGSEQPGMLATVVEKIDEQPRWTWSKLWWQKAKAKPAKAAERPSLGEAALRESAYDLFDEEQQQAIRAYFHRLDSEP